MPQPPAAQRTRPPWSWILYKGSWEDRAYIAALWTMDYRKLPWWLAAVLLPLPALAQTLYLHYTTAKRPGNVGFVMCAVAVTVMVTFSIRIWQLTPDTIGRRLAKTFVRTLIAWTFLSAILLVGAAATFALTPDRDYVTAAAMPGWLPVLAALALLVISVPLGFLGIAIMAFAFALGPDQGPLTPDQESRANTSEPSGQAVPQVGPIQTDPKESDLPPAEPGLRARLAVGGIGLFMLGITVESVLSLIDSLLNELNHSGCPPKRYQNCFATSGAPLQTISDLNRWLFGAAIALALSAALPYLVSLGKKKPPSP